MNNNFNNEQIVVELRELIAGIESVEERFDAYCEAMKHIFLSSSCNN